MKLVHITTLSRLLAYSFFLGDHHGIQSDTEVPVLQKKPMFQIDTARAGIERWECPCGVVTITTRFKGGRISD